MVDGYGIVDDKGNVIIEQAALNGLNEYGSQIVSDHNAVPVLVAAARDVLRASEARDSDSLANALQDLDAALNLVEKGE